MSRVSNGFSSLTKYARKGIIGAFASAQIGTLSVLAVPANQCGTSPVSQATGTTAQTEISLTVLPASAWAANGGTINAVCAPVPNPREASFVEVPNGVSFTAESSGDDCCTCAARSRSFSVPTTRASGARLRGTFDAGRGANDIFSVGSMRVTLTKGGSTVASRAFADEDRPNNNCVGSSETTEILAPNVPFDVDLSSFASDPAQDFDGIRIDIMGYACGNAESSVVLEDLRLAPGVSPANAPAPSAAPAPTMTAAPPPSPPASADVSVSLTPSQWGAYRSGTIGSTNDGIVSVANVGPSSASAVVLEIHTETNNPAGAPIRTADSRCVQQYDARLECVIGKVAAGASTTVAITFNSFSDTTVVASATATEPDPMPTNNHATGTVYPRP